MKRSITTRRRLEEAEVLAMFMMITLSLKKRMSGAATYKTRFQKSWQWPFVQPIKVMCMVLLHQLFMKHIIWTPR